MTQEVTQLSSGTRTPKPSQLPAPPKDLSAEIASPAVESGRAGSTAGAPRRKQEGWAPSLRMVVGFAAVFSMACFVLFDGIGSFPLFNPDEALYAEPAREMLESGEYITTYLNYVVRFTKPPLCIWAMAGCFNVFGVTEFAARFFGAACGAILVGMTYLFLNRFAGRRPALIGSIALLTAPLFYGTAREAITDAPLSLFMACAFMCLFTFYKNGRKLWLWTAYALIGLAVMTKGPVAVVLPVLVLAVFHTIKGDILKAISLYRPIAGAVIVGAISLPWFITEIVVTKGAYFQEFIMRENFQRFTSVVDAHKHGWWYHVAAMFGGFFPWAVFLPGAIARAISPIGQAVKRGVSYGPELVRSLASTVGSLNVRQELLLYSLCWAAVTLVFFSASVSKLLPYTLPAFPALAILVAMEIDAALDGNQRLRLLAPMGLLACIFGAAIIVANWALTHLSGAPPGLSQPVVAFAAFESVCAVACLLVMRFWKPQAAIALFAGLFTVSVVHFSSEIIPVLSNHWEGPIPAFARFAADSNEPIIVFGTRKPGFPFYAKRKVYNAPHLDYLTDQLKPMSSAYILSKVKTQGFMQAISGTCKVVARDGEYILVHWRKTK